MTDKDAILDIHRKWWECNHTGDVPRMATCFAGGASFLMYNLNGHPYYGRDGIVQLWTWYGDKLMVGECDVRIQQMEIAGDTAWIASETYFPAKRVKDPGSASSLWPVTSDRYSSSLIRSTEIYRRDDGDGNAEWKIWHFHCSLIAPSDEIRPGYHDTGRVRGLGYRPTSTSDQY